MTECVLHVGTEKTGSKSLQSFMRMNRSQLASRGIWVPACLVPAWGDAFSNQLLISTASRLSITTPDDLQRALGLSNMEMVREHRHHVATALQAEASALAYKPNRMLVSNEHVHSRLQADEDLENLRQLLAPFCKRFRVVVYLRRQDEMALSLAVTAVREGKPAFQRVPDLSKKFDPVLDVDFMYFNYEFLLGRLERVFGTTAMDVRIYQKDVIGDFFSRLQIDLAGLTAVNRENRGMSEAAVQLLVRMNQYPQFHGPIRGEILEFLASQHVGQPGSAPQKEIARFRALFAESNEVVRRKWFRQHKQLFDDS